MANHVQLELFDLQNHTSQTLVRDVYTVMQMRKKLKGIDYEQLELNLFSKQIDKGSFEYLNQAA